ncbi:MAG: isoquinoline 1-oxidoreductase [Frankiales bacterium]|nr:isoquinoline 1-oxidoreductase [Frankiales bacterium]
MSTAASPAPPAPGSPGPGLDRRRFLTYLVGAPTLAVAVSYGLGPSAAVAAIPGSPESADFMDLGDILILGAKATESQLIQLVLEEDGTVSCALPREEVGQGITTAVAMLIADELDLPLSKVRVTVADARPELLTGQLTGGSNTIRSVYEPVRQAAATMRGTLVAAAAQRFGSPRRGLRTQDGVVRSPDGATASYGSLARAATDPRLFARAAAPKALGTGALVGTPQNRVDARAMVTGQMKYTNDLEPVPGALRAMVRRPTTIRGRVDQILNEAAVRKMPGVVDLAVVDLSVGGLGDDAAVGPRSTGVAVVAETFGQALDAKEALEVTWLPGPVDPAEDDASLKEKLRAVQLPFAVPVVPGVTEAVEGEFYFHFASHAPLETNTAIADVRADGADVWAGTKVPVVAQQTIEQELGVPVKLHVVQGGGSFGRRLFFDGALEAARISKAVGKPVKVMMTRIDDMRHGRARAASVNHVRLTHAAGQVLSMEQRVASVETDFRHGLGEIITAAGGAQLNLPAAALPVSLGGNASFAQTVFLTTVKSPYQFGQTSQLLNELALPFNTASWRSVYSANARGAEEIMVDELAAAMGKDPAAFRLEFLSDERQRAVLQEVLELGEWGKRMPAGTAQGLGFHEEYKSMTACLVEIDARDPQDPRVTRASIVADVGLPINPRGLEAQLQGGLTDAIGTCLRTGLHLEDGGFLEGSYSQFHFPRQADSPPRLDVVILPATTGEPGGAGELGVPAAFGAVANAYARATGTKPRSFPIVFPVDFTPFPTGTGSTRVNPR